jgi:hypothetical protein
LLLFFTSCRWLDTQASKDTIKSDKLLARVGISELWLKEIESVIPKGTSLSDSTDIAARYVDNWVRKQLVLREAEKTLEIDNEELERKALEYKYQLISHEFEKFLVNQKLDSIIPESEIEKYYKENSDNFLLKQNIIKSLFIKLPADAPRINRARTLIGSDNPKDMEDLKSYCFRFADNYSLEDTVWMDFDEVVRSTPYINIPDKVQFLKNHAFTELTDSSFIYLLRVKEYKILDQQSPLEFVRDQIRFIILNRRKVTLAAEFEKEIYNNAVKNKDFEIFTTN